MSGVSSIIRQDNRSIPSIWPYFHSSVFLTFTIQATSGCPSSITNLPRIVCPLFPYPPSHPHALQTLCYPPSPFKRRTHYSHSFFFSTSTILQVRAIVTPSDSQILSASRDSTAISWIKPSGSSFSPASTFRAGSRYINSVAYLPPTPEAPHGKDHHMLTRARTSLNEVPHPGYIVTGGQDSIINIWSIEPSREEPLYTLLGHSDNVCALHASGDGTIISGSWDKCVRLPPSPFLTYALAKNRQSMDKLSACLRPRGTCTVGVGRGSDSTG
jgi:WD40 repeat protein